MAQNYDEMIFHFFLLFLFQIIDPKRLQKKRWNDPTKYFVSFQFNGIWKKLYNSKMKKRSKEKFPSILRTALNQYLAMYNPLPV